MKCPVCGEELTEEQPSDGYDMYVAEDDGNCVECADTVKFYRCTNDHRIYIGD